MARDHDIGALDARLLRALVERARAFGVDDAARVRARALGEELGVTRAAVDALLVALTRAVGAVDASSPSLEIGACLETRDTERDTDPDIAPPERPLPLVSAASPSSKAFALVGRAVKDADTVVDVGGVRVGGDAPPVFFAGPSLVETRAQIRACARAAKDAGAQILWAGCFESRASHHFVEGVGFDALAHLEAAAREVGLPFATDVAAAADVGKVARRVDMVICPERHVGDPALQRALGEIDEPVLLRRGSMASLDEHLRAAEKIAEHGNPDIVLCERAARTLGDLPLLDLSAIPALREITSLPIVVDPTHATFVRRRMQSLAADALALGAHGVILEIHPEPANALGGGQQALTFEMLRALMQRLG